MVDNDPASSCGRAAILQVSSRLMERSLSVASPRPVWGKSLWLTKWSGWAPHCCSPCGSGIPSRRAGICGWLNKKSKLEIPVMCDATHAKQAFGNKVLRGRCPREIPSSSSRQLAQPKIVAGPIFPSARPVSTVEGVRISVAGASSHGSTGHNRPPVTSPKPEAVLGQSSAMGAVPLDMARTAMKPPTTHLSTYRKTRLYLHRSCGCHGQGLPSKLECLF
jgi:hypothetical protein